MQHEYIPRAIHNTDRDECSNDENACEDNSYCVNTIGSFICECEFGYSFENDTCSGIPISTTHIVM